MPEPLGLPARLQQAGVTQREADVLAALAGGSPNAEIARQLFISERTVESHIAALRRKLGTANRRALADVGHALASRRRSPLPAPLRQPRAAALFVGRHGERESLIRAWKEAVEGERRAVLVGGEPGIGKTRLAAEVAGVLHDDEGAIVLYGRCDEDLGVSYQPFVEALRHYTGHAAGPELSQRLGRYAGELVRVLPELQEACPGLPPPSSCDPETGRYRLFSAVSAWLAAASGDGPVLLVLDDLHWATKPTLLLARHVLRSAEPVRLLVIATYRDTELARHHPLPDLLADLRNQNGVGRLPLRGLGEAEVAEYVRATAGRELDDRDQGLARSIHAGTGGNPLFIAEVLRHLAETGAISRRDGRCAGTLHDEPAEIPAAVREVIGRRLSRLSTTARSMLSTAAVIGTEFDVGVLRTACGLEEDELLGVLDEVSLAGLLVELPAPPARYRFGHALIRATLYDTLSAARRSALHRRVGEAIEGGRADAGDEHLPALAHHFGAVLTEPGDTARAAEHMWRAGDRALDLLAHDEAVRYYSSALESLRATPGCAGSRRQQELLIVLGEAQRRAGEPCYRETLLEAARTAQQRRDTDALVRAALTNSRGILPRFTATVDAEQVAVLEAALAAVGPADTRVRARLLAALALELVFGTDAEHRLRLADEALGLAREVGDPVALTQVLLARHWTVPTSALAERVAHADEALHLAQRVGDPVAQSWALSLRFRAAMEGGDVREADRCLDQNRILVADLGQPRLQWVIDVQRAGRALLAYDVEEAERLARAALSLGESAGQLDARLFFGVQMFAVRFEQGRAGEAQPLLDELAGAYRRVPIFRAISAVANLQAGDRDVARGILCDEAAEAFAGVTSDVTWLASLCLLATVAASLDERGHAAALIERLTPFAAHCPTLGHGGTVLGSVAHHLGLLARTVERYDDAEEHFQAATARHQTLGAPAWSARTRLEWARTLLARSGPGDRERAAQLRRDAGARITTPRWGPTPGATG